MVLLTDSFLMDLSILVVGVLGIFYWLATKNFGHWRKKGVPYIEPKPFVGNLQDMALGKTSMGELLAKFYSDAVGKPYIGMFAFHRPILLVRDTDVIKSILVKDFNYFRDRTFSPDEKLDPMFTKNLFGLSGPRWRHIRVKLTPTFTSGKMKLMYEFVNECGKEMVQLVDREIGGGESGVLEMREILARYTTDTVASVGFGIQGNALKEPDAEFRRVLRKVVDFDFWLGLKAAVAFFAPSLLSTFRVRVWDSEITDFTRRVVWQTVEHREKTGLVRKDFLDLLMQIRAKGHVDGDGAQQPAAAAANGDAAADGKTNGHAKDADGNIEFDGDLFAAQAFVFLAAGFETSSTTQTFAMYELACHPDVQTRLRQEIRDALRANGGQLTYDAMNNMTYLHHVIQEILRLYPVVPFLDRVSLADYKLPNTNITLDKGTTVMIPILGIQRDPAIFEDPNSFRPDRFDESKGPVPPFPHMAFGEGPRACIGMRMGYMQVKVGLVHFLNHYEVRPSKHTVVPAQFDPKSFLLASNGGMRLTVTKLHDAVC